MNHIDCINSRYAGKSAVNSRETRQYKRRVSARRCLRNAALIFIIIAAFCSGFFGHTLLSAHAEEKPAPAINKYYTSIQLKHGDSLWDLANIYSKGSDYTVREYVDEIKRMNHLKSENIHAGEYLTIVYFK